jgi:hypothetical protein
MPLQIGVKEVCRRNLVCVQRITKAFEQYPYSQFWYLSMADPDSLSTVRLLIGSYITYSTRTLKQL